MPKTKGTTPDQLELSAHARRTDPATSQQAALDVTNLRASQARILQMFRLYGDMHDKQLEAYLHDAERAAGVRLMSSSGIRSRRSELAKPNMERLEQLVQELVQTYDTNYELQKRLGRALSWDDRGRDLMDRARDRLRIEGLRSPLWDTGRRVVVDGRSCIVWGLAK